MAKKSISSVSLNSDSNEFGISTVNNSNINIDDAKFSILCFSACKSQCSTKCESKCGSECASSCSTNCSSACWSICSGGVGELDKKKNIDIKDIVI